MSVVARCRAASHRLLCERPIAVLLVLFLSAVAVIIWHTHRQQYALVEAQAMESAKQLADALAKFRTIYTSEVVERVRQQGITITHDYQHKDGAIPLPATLSMMLGNQIGAGDSNTRTRLYSAFPFPWRSADGGLTDEFAADAWEALTQNPDTAFYRLDEVDGVPVLRYATADVMRSACVDCHNSHPDSPKTDWKIGDVRGVLEVIEPLVDPLAQSHTGLVDTTVLMLLMTLGGLLVIGVILGNLRRVAAEAQDLAEQTNEANSGLKKEVTERKRAEEELLASKHDLQMRVVDLEEAQSMLEMQGQSLVGLADDLFIARDKVAEADRAKSEFVATMSHELRTPLNAIIGFSEIIANEILGPVGNAKYRQYAMDIQASGQHLLDLINDILDLSKIESGKDELRDDEIEIPLLVHSALNLVSQGAERDGIRLSLDLPEQLPTLRADERKLKQILVNLLSNAVKFTDTGGEVKLSAWCRMDSGYVFQVVDTGIGIAPEDIPKVFSRFGQVDGKLSRQYQGTGLGLPLTKALIELHSGVIDLQSDLGVGTTVTVSFPAERAVQAGQSVGAAT